MGSSLPEKKRGKTVSRGLMEHIDTSYPRGWFVALDNETILAAAADFHELEHELRMLGRDPRNTLVIEAGTERPEFVTIFI